MLTIEEEKRDKRSICGQFFPITEQIFPIEGLHPSFSISSTDRDKYYKKKQEKENHAHCSYAKHQ